jgi:hypothetical protein
MALGRRFRLLWTSWIMAAATTLGVASAWVPTLRSPLVPRSFPSLLVPKSVKPCGSVAPHVVRNKDGRWLDAHTQPPLSFLWKESSFLVMGRRHWILAAAAAVMIDPTQSALAEDTTKPANAASSLDSFGKSLQGTWPQSSVSPLPAASSSNNNTSANAAAAAGTSDLVQALQEAKTKKSVGPLTHG